MYIGIRPNNDPIGVTEDSIRRGQVIATGLRNIVMAGECLKSEGINMYCAELGVTEGNLIFIPSKSIRAKVIGVEPVHSGSSLGEARFSSTKDIDTPRRLARIAIKSGSDIDKIILDVETVQETDNDPLTKPVAKYEHFSFILDEHTIASHTD